MEHPSEHAGRTFYIGLLEALTAVMGAAKPYLVEHSRRVVDITFQLSSCMELAEHATAELVFAAALADLGMIGVAEDAWENPRPVLDARSRSEVDGHPVRSEATLASIPHLEGVAKLVRHHHEWWNGSGYPDGLRGEEIPLGARILRLADTISALRAPRPQRPALAPASVTEVITRSAGIEFCPAVVETYLKVEEAAELRPFVAVEHRGRVRSAATRLLPAEVSPLSTDHFLDILATLIDVKDPYTGGHSRRVAHLTVAVSDALGLDQEVRRQLWASSYLHDLGKLGVPLRVLTKEGPLDRAEWAEIRAHSVRGAEVLEGIPALEDLAPGVRHHHERWDGTGYPDGLQGDSIPMVSRVLAVCDAYDAMTSTRAYRSSRSHEDALEEIALCAGCYFDPDVADVFLSLPEILFRSLRRTDGAARRAVPQSGPFQVAVGDR